MLPTSAFYQNLHYFDPRADIENESRNLPHWRQPGVTYFVTFRLADALPQAKLQEWREERRAFLDANPESWSETTQAEWFALFPDRLQTWLDKGYGECWLQQPELGKIVDQALLYFDGDRYDLLANVVMPNHVHALLTPKGEHRLDQILHSWKSFTAKAINQSMKRTGEVWQHEGYDHILRTPQAAWAVAHYIMENPAKAGITTPFLSSRVPHT
jgi:REP element-mobilizing transposase RayT